MKIAFVIFDGMTALDFIGIYDTLTRLKTMGFMPNLEWDICAYSPEVRDIAGLRIVPTRVARPLDGYDLVVIPGGFSTRTLIGDAGFIEWIKTSANCPLKASVCTGSLLLGAAGFLKDKKATTHQSVLSELTRYCSGVLDRRIVDEGNVITARGVTSSIDLGLYLCEKIAGRDAKEKIRIQMDYKTD